MNRFDSTVTALRAIATDYYELRFAWPVDVAGLGATAPLPGTFLTIRTGGDYDPVLRRPFAFSDFSGAGLAGTAGTAGTAGIAGIAGTAGQTTAAEAAIIFQRRGRGTTWLAGLPIGARLDVLAPLGQGFKMPPMEYQPVLLAGGIGIGPILYMARHLASQVVRGLCRAPLTVLGFRSAGYIPDIALPEGTFLCTNDGSAGFKGSVIDWLDATTLDFPPSFLACGPLGMMAALDRGAAALQAPFQAAVEQWMACGVGACAGCAIRCKDGTYIKACVDGPVVDGRLVDWEA
jgi:dihydroorotate dehydrogenase electron transfer subunit